MYSDTLAQFPLPLLSCIGMLIFLGIFLGVVIHTLIMTPKEKYKQSAHLVFDPAEGEGSEQ